MTDRFQLYYALYERTSNGYQWTWHANNLNDSLLDDFRYRIQMPDDASSIRPEDLWGGILKFAHVQGSKLDEHVVLYRFFNGGSDEGRSRVTMLAAWTTKDQFPAPSAATGVLGLLRNRTFEDVSHKAWRIGIERPYSLISNEPLPANVDACSVALRELLCGLTDEDHDYSLTIQNDNHVLTKTLSAALEHREAEAAKRNMEAEERKAEQEKREAEEAKFRADEMRREAEQAAIFAKSPQQQRVRLEKKKRLQRRKITMPTIRRFLAILVGCVVLVMATFFWQAYSLWNSPEVFSPAAQEVVDRFGKLTRDDQTRVFNELERIMNERKQIPSPMPIEPGPAKTRLPAWLRWSQ